MEDATKKVVGNSWKTTLDVLYEKRLCMSSSQQELKCYTQFELLVFRIMKIQWHTVNNRELSWTRSALWCCRLGDCKGIYIYHIKNPSPISRWFLLGAFWGLDLTWSNFWKMGRLKFAGNRKSFLSFSQQAQGFAGSCTRTQLILVR